MIKSDKEYLKCLADELENAERIKDSGYSCIIMTDILAEQITKRLREICK